VRRVWLAGEVILALGMAATAFTGPHHTGTLFVAAVTGISLATHSTNIYALAQEIVGEAGTEAQNIGESAPGVVSVLKCFRSIYNLNTLYHHVTSMQRLTCSYLLLSLGPPLDPTH
jgi:hypothetical protein